MGMEMLSVFVEPITEYLIKPARRQIGYFLCYKSNIASIEKESEKLQQVRDDLKMKEEAGRNNLQQLSSHVKGWSEKANGTAANVRNILQGELRAEVERDCFYVRCPNLKSRYILSRRAKKIAGEVTQLHTEFLGLGDNVLDPVKNDGTPSYTDEPFDSRKLIKEEVLHTEFLGLGDNVLNPVKNDGTPSYTDEPFDSRKLIEEEVMTALKAEKIIQRAKQEKLFEYVVLLTVSQKLDLKSIQGEIARGIGLTLQGDNLRSRAYQLCTRLTGKNSALLILDDVWQPFDLNMLGLPNDSNWVKVILTTRARSVCGVMEAQIIEVGILSEEEALTLLRQKAGITVDNVDLSVIAKVVAKECKGLPLAIVTVAGALKRKGKPLWEDALVQLKRGAPANIPGVLTHVYQPLRLSYDYLDSPEAQKLFLLCSLFEEDSDIFPEELLKYGMGLGMFSVIENLQGARNRVCHLVDTLKDRFLLSQGSREAYVKMHDVVRDVAKSIASHVVFVSHNEEFPRRSSYGNYSHMSIVAKRFDDLPRPICCPRLEFLMVKLFEGPFSLQDDDEMSELRVLSVRGHHSSLKLIPASLRRLSNLKTLFLVNLELDDISIIGELVYLEILSIRDSTLEELPKEIGKLRNLIMLEIWNEHATLKRISRGVLSRLVLLEELHIVKVEDCGVSSLRELVSLSNLTALTLNIRDPGDVNDTVEFPQLQNMCLYGLSSFSARNINKIASITDSNPFFHENVCFELKILSVSKGLILLPFPFYCYCG